MNEEILKHLKEYLQMLIDNNTHKIFYNDLMYEEKTIDCINAINEQQEEIERLNKDNGDITKLFAKEREETKRLHSIIKEVKELLNQEWYSVLRKETITKAREILDKENK